MSDILTTLKNTVLKPYIYKVTNQETGMYYIGSQCRGKTVGVNYFTSSHNKEFREDFKNYGEEKYKIEIIKEFDDPDECVRVENYMIRDHMQLKDGLCLNRFYCCGGKRIFSMVGLHHSEDARKKMSRAHKGRPSPKKGIPLSEETRKRISITKKGIPLSEENRKRISEALKGQPSPHKGFHHTEETRKRISIANKGFHHTEETRKRISIANKGSHRSEDVRKKMSEAHKGSLHSEETRKRISEANKRKISVEGTSFCSITSASKYYNVSTTTIRLWIKNKKHNAFYIEK